MSNQSELEALFNKYSIVYIDIKIFISSYQSLNLRLNSPSNINLGFKLIGVSLKGSEEVFSSDSNYTLGTELFTDMHRIVKLFTDLSHIESIRSEYSHFDNFLENFH